MALQDIILRSTTYSPLTTKGSELTYTELDENFIELYAYLTALNNGSSLTPWSISTTYTGTAYVSYAGNIYKLITSPSLGQVPTSNPTVWQLTSVGELAHEKNKDTYLDKGGSYEVTAQDLHGLVNDQVILTTVAGFEADALNGDLIPNRLYQLTNTYPKYFVRSLTNTTYSNTGWLVETTPNISLVTQWLPEVAYGINTHVSYMNNVYKNLTGTFNSTITPDADTVNWVYISNPTYYNDEIFHNVRFNINGGSVLVYNCNDKYNNTYSGTDLYLRRWGYMDGLYNNNIVTNDAGSVLDLVQLTGGSIQNTINGSSTFQMPFGGFGYIQGCTFNNSIVVSLKKFEGVMNNVSLTNTQLYFANGLGSAGNLQNLTIIFDQLSQLDIAESISTAYTGTVTKYGSTVEEMVDISGIGTTLDVDILIGQVDIIGVYNLITVDPNETIDTFYKYNRLFPVKLKMVSTGSTLTVNTTAYTSISGNGQIIGDVATVVLTDVDYMILEPLNYNGFDIWRIKEYTQTL